MRSAARSRSGSAVWFRSAAGCRRRQPCLTYPTGGAVSRAVAPEHDNRILAAEAKVLRDRDVHIFLARDIRDVVQVAVRVSCFVVDRGMKHASGQAEYGGHRLDGAGAAEHVSRHRLGGADWHAVSVLAQGMLQRRRLRLVVERGGGAVSIDVTNLIGGDVGVAERCLNRQCRPGTSLLRHDLVVGIVAGAKTDHFSEYFGSPSASMFLRRETEVAGPFRANKAVAVAVERPARLFRVLVARGQRLHRRECRDPPVGEVGLAAPREHGFWMTMLQYSHGVAYGLRAG